MTSLNLWQDIKVVGFSFYYGLLQCEIIILLKNKSFGEV